MGKYGQPRGAVPTHGDGGGTLVGGPDAGKYIDKDEMAIHGRAAEICRSGGDYDSALERAREEAVHRRALGICSDAHGRVTEADALKQARAEAAQKADAARKRGQSKKIMFGEGGRVPVDPYSVAVSRRADSILSENGWPRSRFGEALRIARREGAEGR